MYKNFFKRFLDLTLSLFASFVLLPVFVVIATAIKIDSKGPVLFFQKRIGLKKATFDICKFRTMRANAPKDTPTHLLSDPKSYITKTGHFLRQTSLDELPQLYNIVVGDMSIVGPRPALWNQSDLVKERDKYKANDIRPGLTGWAQINGRDDLSIPEKAVLDGEYVKNLSLKTDIMCIVKTIMVVICRSGISEGKNIE